MIEYNKPICVMVNAMCQLGRVTGCPDIWLNMTLGVSCEGVSGWDWHLKGRMSEADWVDLIPSNEGLNRIKGWVREKLAFPGGASDKELTCQCRRLHRRWFDPWVGKIPLEEGMAPHSSILAWGIPLREEPDRLQSIVSNRVGHNWSDLTRTREKPHSLCLSLGWGSGLLLPWTWTHTRTYQSLGFPGSLAFKLRLGLTPSTPLFSRLLDSDWNYTSPQGL